MKSERTKRLLLYTTIFLVALMTTKIGTITIPLGFVDIKLVSYVPAMFVVLALALMKPIYWVDVNMIETAEKWIVYGSAIYLAKQGITIGLQLESLIKVSPAMVLQEFGNIGTMLFAFPLALYWGFGRESIGMTFSIAREQGVAIVGSRYNGLSGPEGRGVVVTYVVGYLIGTLEMSIIVPMLAKLKFLSPSALAMACGVGSLSMQTTGMAALNEIYPQFGDQTTAFAGTSQILSAFDGSIMAVLVVFPLLEFLYKKWETWQNKKTGPSIALVNEGTTFQENTSSEAGGEQSFIEKTQILEFMPILLISAVLALVVNKAAFNNSIMEALPGMMVCTAIAAVGSLMSKTMPGKLPPVLWITIVAVLLAAPFSPLSHTLASVTAPVNTGSILGIGLSFVGIMMAKHWRRFIEIGFKGVVITALVIFGTYAGSAAVAEIVLRVQGVF